MALNLQCKCLVCVVLRFLKNYFWFDLIFMKHQYSSCIVSPHIQYFHRNGTGSILFFVGSGSGDSFFVGTGQDGSEHSFFGRSGTGLVWLDSGQVETWEHCCVEELSQPEVAKNLKMIDRRSKRYYLIINIKKLIWFIKNTIFEHF